jgi:hypothetical protein
MIAPGGLHQCRAEVKRTRKREYSMSIQEVSAEQLAELFHHYHQALGPDSTSADKPDAEAWEHVPLPEKSRLVAAARLALLELAATASEREKSRRYFAKPGEAEWGC